MSLPFAEDKDETDALARLTGFSAGAVAAMTRAVVAGNGRMAQFDHPEFGGPGQWMQGGMLMTSDFSNRDLERRIGRLCEAIVERLPADEALIGGQAHQSQRQWSGLRRAEAGLQAARNWWPSSLGTPNTSGAQNDIRYAWFADTRRLAIDEGGKVTIHDTGGHRIDGVSQQQGDRRTLSFKSQLGAVDLTSLPIVDQETRPRHDIDGRSKHVPTIDPFEALEKLASLHARGVLSDEEFAAKKAEMLARV